MNTIGIRLKKIRKERKMTQTALADGIVNRSYISQIEKGAVQPSLKLLKKLSKRLGCDISEFIKEDKKALQLLDLKKSLSSIEYLVVNGEYKNAEVELETIEREVQNFNNTERGLYYFCKARVAECLHKETEKAIQFYKNSCEKISTSNMDKRLRTINHLVNILIEKEKVIEAFEYLDEAYNDSIFYKTSGIERISILINLGVAHAKLGEHYSAIRFLRQAINASNSTNMYYHTGIAYMVLGLCQRRINDFDNAKRSYELALNYFKAEGDYLNLAGTYTNLGILFRYTSDFNKCFENLKMAKDMYINLDDLYGKLNIFYEIAITYFQIQDYSRVHSYFNHFVKNYDEKTNTNIYIKFLITVGDTYYIENNGEKAISYYEQALSFNPEQSIKKEIIIKLSKVNNTIGDKNSVLNLWKSYTSLID